MDLNVLWKENWTSVAEEHINSLLRNVRIWTEEVELKPHKPEVKCTTLCVASADVRGETKDNWTELVMKRVENFQTNISIASRMGFETGIATPKWTFSSSFLYALSVITTIGYGHVTPKTTAGKIVTVLYAVVGIPIMLMFLSNIGNFLAKIFIGLFGYICRCRLLNSDRKNYKSQNSALATQRSVSGKTTPQRFFPPGTPQDSTEVRVIESWEPEVQELVRRLEKKDDNVPVIGCLIIMTAYLFGGTTLFALWEDWPYLDAFYFCFVTLTTIGFGDFVPGASFLSANTSNQKLVMCCMYVLVGLALIACCFNLMQHQVRKYIEEVGRVMGILKSKTFGRDFSNKRARKVPTISIDDV